MIQTITTKGRTARKPRADAGNSTRHVPILKIRRRPFDAVAYAAALEVLG